MKWLLCLTIATTAQAAVDLKAGVSRVEITPSALMEMYGYANRKCGPANGTHDPLFAKVLVLESGDTRMALVTLDLGSMVSDNLRRRRGIEAEDPAAVVVRLAHTLRAIVSAVRQ